MKQKYSKHCQSITPCRSQSNRLNSQPHLLISRLCLRTSAKCLIV